MGLYSLSGNLDRVVIKQGRDMVFVDTKDIVFIEKEKGTKNLYIITIDNSYKVCANIRDAEEALRNKLFIRCHKSFIVNLQHVSEITATGGKSHIIKFKHKNRTALATLERLRAIKLSQINKSK